MRRAIGVIAAITNRQRHLLVNGGVGFSTFAAGDALSQGARCPPLSISAGQEVAAEPSWGQQFVERTRGVDYARSVKVGLLGILLNGFALGAWYRFLDRYVGVDRTRIRPLLAKCFIDQMVYAPFSITSFVTYATVLGGGGVAAITKETARNLREIFLSTWLMDWKVWPAANLVMFRYIPSSYRPSFASVVQVAWQAYMSSVSYGNPHAVIPHRVEADGREGEAALLARGGGAADHNVGVEEMRKEEGRRGAEREKEEKEGRVGEELQSEGGGKREGQKKGLKEKLDHEEGGAGGGGESLRGVPGMSSAAPTSIAPAINDRRVETIQRRATGRYAYAYPPTRGRLHEAAGARRQDSPRINAAVEGAFIAVRRRRGEGSASEVGEQSRGSKNKEF